MKQINLKLSKNSSKPSSFTISCTISAEFPDSPTRTRNFDGESQLRDTLASVGIPEFRHNIPVQVVNSGFGPSFLEISKEEAVSLKVMDNSGT
jgi:hypothetical protein